MGKITGFLEYQRLSPHYAPVVARLKNYDEFVLRLDDSQASLQGARCMDCGIPFCHNACPVNNIIPDWNDLVYHQQWRQAFTILESTNNFPEFTGRICPAPCEAACTLNVNDEAVGIKSIEQAIIDRAWEQGWVQPLPAKHQTGKQVAIIGSGPAGLAAAQQLARAGHSVTVFEKNDQAGGLLRYGIPDFKLSKALIDRRIEQLQGEGVCFRLNVLVGSASLPLPSGIGCDAAETIEAAQLAHDFDAVVLAGGAEVPRDLAVPGRELAGVHFALEFLIPQNKAVAGGRPNPIQARGKHVVVIGGGDTGSDCVGTANRHGARSVTQLELMPMPPQQENKALNWPYWPNRLRTSSSHEEGCKREFAVATQAFIGEHGCVQALRIARVQWQGGKMQLLPDSESVLPADLVTLAMGFTRPFEGVLEAFGVVRDERGNAQASTQADGGYLTNVSKVFVAGDMRRGQSLVVWAIREGRQCAHAVDTFLMGKSCLPR